jgi:hypothetical protein
VRLKLEASLALLESSQLADGPDAQKLELLREA